MLQAHFNTVEQALLAISKIPANSGHNLHKGTPREAFIREFLEKHLSERVAVGTGEIIDADSKPGEKRNQIDIVIYRRDYPKLDFGGGMNGFLAESVVATVEVKSVLDADALYTSIETATRLKRLKRNVHTALSVGHTPPSILTYVVAYTGPTQMNTVYGWLGPIHQLLKVSQPTLPLDAHERLKVPSPSIDGVFLLGTGFLYFDNSPIGFVSSAIRAANPNALWVMQDAHAGGLLLFFMLLTQATNNSSLSWLHPDPYLKSCSANSFSLGA